MGEPLEFTSKGSPGLCRAVIHDPIDTTGLMLDDLAELREKTRSIVHQPLIDRGYSSALFNKDEYDAWVKHKEEKKSKNND